MDKCSKQFQVVDRAESDVFSTHKTREEAERAASRYNEAWGADALYTRISEIVKVIEVPSESAMPCPRCKGTGYFFDQECV